jgi:hypothetical protein
MGNSTEQRIDSKTEETKKEESKVDEKLQNDAKTDSKADSESKSLVTAQKTIDERFGPLTIEQRESMDQNEAAIYDRISEAQDLKQLDNAVNFEKVDSSADRSLSKEELAAAVNNEAIDAQSRRAAALILSNYDSIKAMSSDDAAGVTDDDIEAFANCRMAQASFLRGISGIDRDGDGNATFEEINNAAWDKNLNPIDRAIADYLNRNGSISANVADQDKWNSAGDTGVTQNDLNFEAEESNTKVGYTELECREALGQFPELKKAGITPADLKALIDNEVSKRDYVDSIQDGSPEFLNRWLDSTVGPAQIKQSMIDKIKADNPNLANLDAKDPANAPVFAAAVLNEKIKMLNDKGFEKEEERLNNKIASMNEEFEKNWEKPDPQDNEPRYLDRKADYDDAQKALEKEIEPLDKCSKRAREIQDNWNSNDPQRMRVALLKSYNPYAANKDHMDKIQSFVDTRPVVQTNVA